LRTRRWLTWLVFTICALAVLEGLGWVSWRAINAERNEARARAQAAFQESIRLALWRMESEVTPIIAQEAARPYFQYRSFYAAQHAYTRMWREVEADEIRVPSPLLERSGQFIRLHFQVEPDGSVTSPQAPTGNMLDLAESKGYVEPEFTALSAHLLDELTRMLTEKGQTIVEGGRRAELDRTQAQPPPQAAQQAAEVEQQQSRKDIASSQKELEARIQAYQNANAPQESARRTKGAEKPTGALADAEKKETAAAPTPAASPVAPPAPPPAFKSAPPADEYRRAAGETFTSDSDRETPRLKNKQGGVDPEVEVVQGPFTPRWRTNPRTGADELVVERAVTLEGNRYIQGFWMDWPALRARVLAAATDLLPKADLRPIPPTPTQSPLEVYRLASIPVYLVPGESPAAVVGGVTPTHATLVVTWLAVLGAIIAIGIVLRTAMELGDRRGRFVSAVTHELRTPLTTFCLYTEMLADGMVHEEAQRRDYLGTLKAESRRLAGIVENVLEYARLGGRPHRNGHAPIGVADLLAQLLPAVERCARQGGMELIHETADLGSARVRAEPRTVERILLNLAENACKYASDAGPDHRLHLSVRTAVDRARPVLDIRIRDHGPGVPRAEQSQIFQPFRRGKRDADAAKSGLGLGLALSRGLARGLGGDLSVSNHPDGGAEFRLTIPIHRAAP
jgi:signal transduction histidine kinase